MSQVNFTGFNELISFYQGLANLSPSSITVPKDFHRQVDQIKNFILASDVSGLVNSLLDFMVNCALVEYNIDTQNDNLTKSLNNWLSSLNSALRGSKVEVGIKGLARQYFRERWKKSSLMVLRTFWEKENDLVVPTKLFFVDGGSVKVKSDEQTAQIGNEKYLLQISDKKTISIPKTKAEKLFVQSPYASWDDDYPTPFLVQRGILRNIKFFEELSKKSETVVQKALEYIMAIKKGTEALVLNNKAEALLSEEDAEKLKKNLKELLERRKTESGVPTYFTDFATQIEHLIPDYKKVLNQDLYTPIERRILQGLGMVEIIQGTGTSRTEAILNPKLLIREVRQGIEDFKSLLKDIVETIRDENKLEKPRLMRKDIIVHSTPITDFITKEVRDHFRNLYDRGMLSNQTYIEVCGEGYIDYGLEKERRENELNRGENILMYPPVIQNIEKDPDAKPESQPKQDKNGDEIDEDKLPPNNKDYTQASLEGAPWSNLDALLKSVPALKKYSKTAQTAFLKAFNSAYKYYLQKLKDEREAEKMAFKVAWAQVKKLTTQNVTGEYVMKREFYGASIDEITRQDLIKQELEQKKIETLEEAKDLLKKIAKVEGEEL